MNGSCSNFNFNSDIMYNIWLGLYPIQVQERWQHERDTHQSTEAVERGTRFRGEDRRNAARRTYKQSNIKL